MVAPQARRDLRSRRIRVSRLYPTESFGNPGSLAFLPRHSRRRQHLVPPLFAAGRCNRPRLVPRLMHFSRPANRNFKRHSRPPAGEISRYMPRPSEMRLGRLDGSVSLTIDRQSVAQGDLHVSECLFSEHSQARLGDIGSVLAWASTPVNTALWAKCNERARIDSAWCVPPRRTKRPTFNILNAMSG